MEPTIFVNLPSRGAKFIFQCSEQWIVEYLISMTSLYMQLFAALIFSVCKTCCFELETWEEFPELPVHFRTFSIVIFNGDCFLSHCNVIIQQISFVSGKMSSLKPSKIHQALATVSISKQIAITANVHVLWQDSFRALENITSHVQGSKPVIWMLVYVVVFFLPLFLADVKMFYMVGSAMGIR